MNSVCADGVIASVCCKLRRRASLRELLLISFSPFPPPPPSQLLRTGGPAAAKATADVEGAWKPAAAPSAALAPESLWPVANAPGASPPPLRPAALAAGLFGAALQALPAASRQWFSELRDAGRAERLEAAVSAFVAPALIAEELRAAKGAATPAGGGGSSGAGLTVRASAAARELTAAFSIEEAVR